MEIIYEKNDFRIIEEVDHSYTLKDLKGDTFDPKYVMMHGKDMTVDLLKEEEKRFEEEVESLGVYGYVLEKWNPKVGKGWEVVDSCYGFVGKYSNENKHYIVSEFKIKIHNSLRKIASSSS